MSDSQEPSQPTQSATISTITTASSNEKTKNERTCFNALVIDSGAIIKTATHYSTGISKPLLNSARTFYTVEGVLKEIRDSKSRHVLATLPFDIQVREPRAFATQAVAKFARLTGDYQSLSSVDLKVLGLQYELGTLSDVFCFLIDFTDR